jgi:methylamine dehydrogenase heavy chain
MERAFLSVAVAAGLVTLAATLAGATPAFADETKSLPEDAKLMGEQHSIAILSKPHPKRLYVLEPVFPHIVASKVWVIEGDKQEIVGMLSGGYLSNFAIAPDSSQLYLFETYWSKGTRGTRSDFITFFDGQTLDIKADVDLPKGRFLVVPKKQNADITPDGRYLLSYNLAPSTSVSVVDTKEKKYKGDLEIPGCGLVFPSAGNRLSTVCSDGTLLTVKWDAALKTTTHRDGPFFDAENDPVFEHAAFDKKKGRVHWVTYEGNIISADLSKDKPVIGKPWSMLSAEDKAEGWVPGGWQLITMHQPTNRIFVLMHKGPKWTHKQPGEEVWVFDGNTGKRLDRIHLKEHATSLAISQDAEPYLFTQTEKPSVITYNVADGKEVGEMKFGISPYLLFTAGD